MKTSNSDHKRARTLPLTEAERVAAAWVLRQNEGLSSAEETDLARWLAEDPQHARLLEEMEQTSRLLDGLKFQRSSPTRQAEPPRHSRRDFMRALGGVAAAAVIGFVAWQFFDRAPPPFTVAASTARGEFQRLALPDGSHVLLNTDTAVDVCFSDQVRQVNLLHGQAYFEVAKNPLRPFVVHAGRVAVTAVGTAFEVHMRDATLDVLVTEGRVQVSSELTPEAAANTGTIVLGPDLSVGHRAQLALDATLAPRSAAMVVSTVEPRVLRAATAWQSGRLEFFDQPLSDVVSEFNRYNRRRIVIADEVLAARRFGGAFASHQVEPFLELLEQSFGVVVEQRDEETVLRRGL